MEKKGLDKNKKILAMLREQLEYNKGLLKLQQEKNLFDDKWRDYLRRATEYENDERLNRLISEIKVTEEQLKVAESNLKNGVDIKITGVG